jgi:hypothetical protein
MEEKLRAVTKEPVVTLEEIMRVNYEGFGNKERERKGAQYTAPVSPAKGRRRLARLHRSALPQAAFPVTLASSEPRLATWA